MSKTLKTGLSIIDREQYFKRFGGQEKDFAWLMESLIAPNDKYRGCEVIFPDTVLFLNGKPSLSIRMDPKDFCIYGSRTVNKLNLQNICKEFQNVMRERRKDTVGIFINKFGPHIF